MVATIVLRAVVACCQFAALALLANRVGPALFGEFVFLTAGARLGGALSAWGAGPVLVAAGSAAVDRWGLEASRMWPRAVVAGAITAVVYAVAFSKTGLTLGMSFVWWPLLVGLCGTWLLMVEAFKGRRMPLKGVVLDTVPTAVGALALVFLGAGEVRLVVVVVSFQGVAALVASLAYLRLRLGREMRSESRLDRRFLLTVSSLISLALPLAVVALAGLLAGPVEAGRLAAVLRLLAPTTMAVGAVAAVFSPRLVRRDPRTMRYSVLFVGAFALPWSIALFAFPGLLPLLMGPEFEGLDGLVRIVAAGQVVNGLTGIAVELGQIYRRELVDVYAVGIAGLGVFAGATILVANGADTTVVVAACFSGVMAVRALVMFFDVYVPTMFVRGRVDA